MLIKAASRNCLSIFFFYRQVWRAIFALYWYETREERALMMLLRKKEKKKRQTFYVQIDHVCES
jgi:hypothetical protein